MSDLKIKFSGVDTSIMNSLRRIMLSEVKTIAIDIIKVGENNGIMTDEILGHRLGLIPIKRHNKYTKKVTLTLNVSNDTDIIKTVYSSDLKYNSEDIEIPDKNIIITKLDKGHFISLIAETEEGTGYIHAKWNPTAGLAYKIENGPDDTQIFIFNIESIGNMTPKEILEEAFDTLIEKFQRILI